MSAPKPLSPEELDDIREATDAYIPADHKEVVRLLATIEAARKEIADKDHLLTVAYGCQLEADKEIAKLKIDLELEKELVRYGSDEVVNRNQEIAKLKVARDRALALIEGKVPDRFGDKMRLAEIWKTEICAALELESEVE